MTDLDPQPRPEHQRGAGTHREALLREGRRQLFDRGYHAMTVDGLLSATGVPKGSFYHHFGSKEGFVSAVLEEYGGFQRTMLATWAARDDLDTAAQLRGYFEELAAIVVDSGYRHTDLAGKLATDISADSEPLRLEVAAVIEVWRRDVEQVLAHGQSLGQVRADRSAESLSVAIHALADGAFMIAATTHDDHTLATIGDAIERLIRARG